MIVDSPLGKATQYIQTYSPSLLYPIPRSFARNKLLLFDILPFKGVDIWNGFELSWLNLKGKPEIAMAEFKFSHTTPHIVESKSLKLYLNSFNQSQFQSFKQVEDLMKKDLSRATGADVEVTLIHPSQFHLQTIEDFSDTLLDNLDIETSTYDLHPPFLKTGPSIIEESLYSHLFKSNCMATGQPDWGALFIRDKGRKICHEGLLKYIISFRNHTGFAEFCVEKIFCDIMERCQPQCLTVYARYTRRGGLDINPFRSNFEEASFNHRQPRQ